MRIPRLASWAAGRVSSMISKLEKLLGGVRWIIIIQVHGVPYVFQLEECKVVCMYSLSEMDTLMSYCQAREVLEVIAERTFHIAGAPTTWQEICLDVSTSQYLQS